MSGSAPVDGNHALLIGWVWGALSTAATTSPIETEVELTNGVDGAYSDTMLVTRPSGTYEVTITPRKADDDEAD